MNEIILSTGDLKRDYEVVDIVHAAFSIRSWWIRTGGRETVAFFPEINKRLRAAAKEQGCDAVIWTDYEMTREESRGALGAKTTTVILAYGTGVKFKNE